MGYLRLDEVCALNMGQSPSSDSYNQEGNGIPFFQGNADFGEMYPITRVWCDKPTKIVNRGTLLISVRAPIGALNFATEKSCIGRGLAGLTVKAGYDLKYIYYALRYKEQELNNRGTGSTFKAISKSSLGEVLIPDISIGKQRDCVKKLDLIQRTFVDEKKQIVQLDRLIKSRFIEMFGDPFTNPKRWEKGLLGDVCDVRDGTHDSPQYYNEGYPLLTSKNITSGKIDLSNCNYISEEDFIKINERSKVDIGDIIMPMIGTVGKPLIVDIQPDFAIKNVALIKFGKAVNVRNIYIKALLESDYFDRSVISKIRGGTQKFIALGDIRKLEILLPTMDMQQKFEDFAIQVDGLKVTVQKSLDKIQLLFDSLMQEYFG